VLAAVVAIASIAALRPSVARQAVAVWGAVVAIVSAGIVGFTELEGLAMLAGAWVAILSVAVHREWPRGVAWAGPALLALFATPRLAELWPGWTVVPVLAIWAALLAWGPPRGPRVQVVVAFLATIVAGLAAPTPMLPLVWVVLAFALGRHFHTALAIPAIAFAALVPGDPLLGLVPAAVYSLLRFVFRGRTVDLLVGALALDVALCIQLARSSVVEPVAYVGTVGLTILVLAHLLRRTLDRDWAIVLRYGACGAIHLTAFATWIDDPHRTLAMIVLCLAGAAAGALLRVRPYLFLGSAFLLATLAVNLVRFGLEHNEFWAFYLSVLGLLVLAAMVVRSTARDRLHAAGSTIRQGLATWE
jgi:fluoride ion exporter CrcB/FEX